MIRDRQAVGSALHSACIHVLRFVRTVDVDSGLSAARLSALSVLVFGGPRTSGELAEAEGVRSPTITALVNGLEAEGLVRRVGAGGKDRDQRRGVVEATRQRVDDGGATAPGLADHDDGRRRVGPSRGRVAKAIGQLDLARRAGMGDQLADGGD